MKQVSMIKYAVVIVLGMLGIELHCNEVISVANNKPLRILIVVEKFPLLSETTILNQFTGLLKLGHEVYMYATLGKGYVKKMHPDIKKYNLLEKTFFKDPPELTKFDIIYCQFGPLGNELLNIKKKHPFSAKLVTCFRGYDLSRYIKSYGTHIYDDLFKEGDLFLPVCDYFKDRLIDLGCSEEKIITQHSAIDLSKFIFKMRKKCTPHSVIKIVTVCRLVPKKGIFIALDAIKKVMKRYPNIEYTIVGDGPLMRKIRNEIRELRMRRRVHLVGWADQDEIIKILNKSHIVVLASLRSSDGNEEGIPNALKEGMATGLIAVSTDHSGIPELIENHISGLLVEPGNANMLAKKIIYLITNQTIWEDMAKAARKVIEEEFDVEKMNKRLVTLFYQLCREKL